jgi:hypothetical protein
MIGDMVSLSLRPSMLHPNKQLLLRTGLQHDYVLVLPLCPETDF